MNQEDRPQRRLEGASLGEIGKQFELWEQQELAAFLRKAPERQKEFRTLTGFPLKRVYTALDLAESVTLLNYGRVIVDGARDAVVADPRTHEVYLGV